MQKDGLALAKISNADRAGQEVECLFNPKEYTINKTNQWTAKPAKGSNIAPHEFSGGGPMTLQMQLFFDTYAVVKQGAQAHQGQDVREAYTAKIWEMMKVDPSLPSINQPKGSSGQSKHKKGRPPIVRFQWGTVWTFKAVITSLRERFTFFDRQGTPLRSTLDITFQQIQDEAWSRGTNPTSGGTGGERVWLVQEGDTLGWIAYQEYGDAALWRLIADSNRLKNVRDLVPGTRLEIPNAR